MLAGAAAAQAPQAQIQPQAPMQPQAPTQLQGPAAPPAQPQENPGTRPGFIDAFGHWIQNSVTSWNDGVNGGIKGAGDVARDAANAAGTATRDTAGAVVRLPSTRVIAEREVCPVAPNGAPDCRMAAELICKRHGFGSGSSIDFQTAENCPPVALNRSNGEPPPPCVMQSYVTRALCQ
jgi:hypothetical protein